MLYVQHTLAHIDMYSLVNPFGDSDKGVWVNKKLGSMMGLSICKHLTDWQGRGEAE